MRKALIIGINHYDHLPRLTGCVRDARRVAEMLEEHHDGTANFVKPRLLTADGAPTALSRVDVREACRELFDDRSEIALLYFAGHGHLQDSNGYLCCSDARTGEDGVLMADVMRMASESLAANRIVVLDSCHGGVAGSRNGPEDAALLKEGTTVLTASTGRQSALERRDGSGGVFTSLLLDALDGAAANLLGDVTPGSVYAHVDQSLANFGPRPMFKANVRSFVALRRAKPPIPRDELKRLATMFPDPERPFPLDPSYERVRSSDELADPGIPPPDPANVATFRVLQNYARVNVVRPVGAEHMWNAAMEWKACELTPVGRHYRGLVAERLIR